MKNGKEGMEDKPQRHGDTEKIPGDELNRKPVYYDEELTEGIISCAIEVHRHLGPGLLESAYEDCLCYELTFRGIPFERQRLLPLEYKGVKLDCGYRMDIVVNKRVVTELKCVEKLMPIS